MADHFAVIADIHGNSDALAAVLSDIDRRGIREVFALGDYFSGPLDAKGTAEQLLSRSMRAIRGNHDRHLISHQPDKMGPSDRVAYDQLPGSAMHWLQTLSPMLTLGDDLLACHGTPFDDNRYWAEEVTDDGQVSVKADAVIEALSDGLPHGLFLCAHSHLPRVTQLENGRVLLNPGSVGCPAYEDDTPVPHVVETGVTDASYAIVSREQGGWNIALCLVPYDASRMAGLARRQGRMDWANALETGRVSR